MHLKTKPQDKVIVARFAYFPKAQEEIWDYIVIIIIQSIKSRYASGTQVGDQDIGTFPKFVTALVS